MNLPSHQRYPDQPPSPHPVHVYVALSLVYPGAHLTRHSSYALPEEKRERERERKMEPRQQQALTIAPEVP